MSNLIDKERVKELYLKEGNISKVSKLLGVKQSKIRWIMESCFPEIIATHSKSTWGKALGNEQQLIDLFNEGKSIKEIMALTGMSKSSVFRLKKNKVESRLLSNDIVNKIPGLYRKYWSTTLVAKELGLTQACIHKRLQKDFPELLREKFKQQGYEGTRKHPIKHNYFEQIDTQEKAYILGFLYADGYNYELTHTVSISFNFKDSEITEFIKRELNSTATYYPYAKGKNTFHTIHFNSKQLSQDLKRHGCYQAKTYSLKFPTTVPDHLMNHFIRGVFDGDGCIFKHKLGAKNRQQNCRTWTITSAKSFLVPLMQFLTKKLDLDTRPIYCIKKADDRIGTLAYYRNSSIKKIYDYLYENASFYLERKKVRYQFHDN